MDNIRLYTAQSRPDLWEILKSPSHPLNAAWPTFIDQDKYFQHYCSQLDRFEAFAPMQYAIVDVDTHGGEHIIACGRSVPFYWPELDRIGGKRGLRQHPEILHSLPDEGYDGILSRAFEQQLAREGIAQDMNGLRPISDPARTRTEAPNALSAISITVSPQYRSQGLADLLIMAMKQTALDQGYDALVVPLRPTRKSDYPRTEMADYLSWLATPNPDYGVSKMKAKSTDPSLPFDPWLRKHVRLGARVVKVARRSMYVEGSAQDWQQWTGVNFSQLIGRKDTPLKQEANSGKLYLEAVFPKDSSLCGITLMSNAVSTWNRISGYTMSYLSEASVKMSILLQNRGVFNLPFDCRFLPAYMIVHPLQGCDWQRGNLCPRFLQELPVHLGTE